MQTGKQHPVSQAAERLNAALSRLEQRIIDLRQDRGSQPELELLERENLQLHEENRHLRDLLDALEMRLELSIVQLESLMSEGQKQ